MAQILTNILSFQQTPQNQVLSLFLTITADLKIHSLAVNEVPELI